ncbi:MAG: DUF262 domain-containing protein [Candidatus Riflebacteria bacterium]|nr:DUF262 domain-containing protein [Candidatus Riflebacteria bacterium]
MSEQNSLEVFEMRLGEMDQLFFNIPIYQRQYDWGPKEIYRLLSDLYERKKKSSDEDLERPHEAHYFLGTLILTRNANCYDVIDGQQRLTTLFLLGVVFRCFWNDQNRGWQKFLIDGTKCRLSFKVREDDSNVLRDLAQWNWKSPPKITEIQKELDVFSQQPKVNQSLFKGLKTVLGFLAELEKFRDIESIQEFSRWAFHNIQMIRTVLPENLDLTEYFVVLNDRGEQLENHEILKNQLLTFVKESQSDNEYKRCARIWELVSQMNQYVEEGLTEEERTALEKKCVERKNDYLFVLLEPEILRDRGDDEENKDNLEDLLKDFENPNVEGKDSNSKKIGKDHSEERSSEEEVVSSIIGFSDFILHVYKIFRHAKTLCSKGTEEAEADQNVDSVKKNTAENPDKQKKIIRWEKLSLNGKDLLEAFQIDLFDPQKGEFKASEFIQDLLKYRILFDQHILKRWTKGDHEYEWLLKRLFPDCKRKETSKKDCFFNLHIQSLLTVSGQQPFEHWLTPTLCYLGKLPDAENSNLSDAALTTFLEKLDNSLAFARYDGGELIAVANAFMQDPMANGVERVIDFDPNLLDLDQGVRVPRYWFFKLDYCILKNDPNSDDSTKFRFTFRNSVEHIYPQNPRDGKPMVKLNPDRFGNLALMSIGENSSFSSKSVQEKREQFRLLKNNLKLSKAYKNEVNNQNWEDTFCEEHRRSMLQLLSEYHNKIAIIQKPENKEGKKK